MDVLFLDFLYPRGHIRMNTEIINCLATISKVSVLCPKEWYSSVNAEVEMLEIKKGTLGKGKLLNRLKILKVMKHSAALARKRKFDYVFISSYETVVFAIGRLLFRKNEKLFLLHNNNIDELHNPIKRFFFKRYMKKVEHVVLEEFIGDYLVEAFDLDRDMVHTLPYPLYENKLKESEHNIYSCVGLSNSNDSNIIDEIIDIEKQQELFKKENCKVVLKSKSMEFDNGYLTVVKGYLETDRYYEYINRAKCLLLPFPASFRYRMSGSLMDALSNNKIVFGIDIPLIRFYAEKYPSVCKTVYNVADIFDYVCNMNPESTSEDLGRFKNDHSSTVIAETLHDMFRRK